MLFRSSFLCYKAMEDANLENTEIETPICKMKTKKLNEDKYAFVPILNLLFSISVGTR